MKRLYIFILLSVCLAVISVPAQTKKNKSSNSKAKKAQTTTQKKSSATASKTKMPERLFSIEELESQRKTALESIELTTQLLNETSASAKSSLNRLNLLSQQLSSRRKVIKVLGQEITAIDSKIKTLQSDIEILNKDLEKTKANYAKSMQRQHQEYRSAQYKMLFVLAAENIQQSYRRMCYLREYSNWQKDEAGRIINKQDEIKRRREQLEQSRTDKQMLLTQRESENKKLEEEETLQQKEVRSLNSKQKDLQQQLARQKKEADALNRQIENMIAEEMKKSEETNKNTASSKTGKPTETSPSSSGSKGKPATTTASGASKGNYVLTDAELNLSNNFANNKGKLPFPLNGRHTIVSRFGEHQHRELSHVRTNNSGIDIQTAAGTDACAVFKGVVSRVFVMPGFNNNVIVRHGNYLTVYSNLSQVYVKAGDVIGTRQAIGKIYTDTTNGNSTILHFQIWKERTKLNPEQWLK